jgi:hypothetical protein
MPCYDSSMPSSSFAGILRKTAMRRVPDNLRPLASSANSVFSLLIDDF